MCEPRKRFCVWPWIISNLGKMVLWVALPRLFLAARVLPLPYCVFLFQQAQVSSNSWIGPDPFAIATKKLGGGRRHATEHGQHTILGKPFVSSEYLNLCHRKQWTLIPKKRWCQDRNILANGNLPHGRVDNRDKVEHDVWNGPASFCAMPYNHDERYFPGDMKLQSWIQ